MTATAPSGSRLAIIASMNPLICTTPRPTNTGRKLRTTVRTPADDVSSEGLRPGARRSTVGSCTANCSRDPSTEAHAKASAKAAASREGPSATMAAIITALHSTGAV